MGNSVVTVPYQLAQSSRRATKRIRSALPIRACARGMALLAAVTTVVLQMSTQQASLAETVARAAVGAQSPAWQEAVAIEVSAPVSVEPGPSVEAARRYAAGRGVVGLAVLDRQTGSYADNGVTAHTPMGSASVIKVVIAEELLYRAGLGEIDLAPPERDRMETMLIDSNDSAASSLYRQFGGISLIEAALSRHGLTESRPPTDPQFWGNTMVTAHDIAKFYDNVLSGSIPPQDRGYLLDLLHRMAPTATDGFGQLFGVAGIDPRPDAAVKQGWMCCLDDARNVHSTAVLGGERLVLIILTQYSTWLSYEYGQITTTEVARLVIEELS